MSIDANGDFKPGLKTTQWLATVGINNIRAVAKAGVVETCILLKRAGYPVTVNMAYGLQADLMGTTWDRLPASIRDELRAAYRHGCSQGNHDLADNGRPVRSAAAKPRPRLPGPRPAGS
jgi:hypothetical protein